MTNDGPLEAIAAAIAARRRFAVASHLRPDGDSICTSLGLALALESLGRSADCVNVDRTPSPFHAFPDAGRIRVGQIDPAGYDAVILLECADVSRSGHTGLDGAYLINIDHHYTNARYAALNWVDPEAPAVGEMAFALCERLGVRPSPRMANHFYCAIASDTGSFQFSNTSARAFEASARLVRAGANPIEISEALYHINRPEKIKLLGRVLSTLRMEAGGTIALISMFRSDLRDLHLAEIDTEDITTLARSIAGVSVVLFFKEIEPEVFRVSIRSKGDAHAARVAEHFGGGGHAHAAGFTVNGPYERLIVEVPATVARLLAAPCA